MENCSIPRDTNRSHTLEMVNCPCEGHQERTSARELLRRSTNSGTKMEAIVYRRQAEHFNQLLRCGSVYDFYNVGFDPTEMIVHLRFKIRSHFCMILNSATTTRTPHGPVHMLRCLWRFPEYDDIFFGKAQFFNVIGLVVHVGDIEFRSLYLRRTPTRIIALIIFVRVWDQQLTRNLTRWRSARTHFDCFVATLTRVDRRADELSTTYESDIIFNPDSASANEFNVLRQALAVSPSNVQEQSVNYNNMMSANYRTHISNRVHAPTSEQLPDASQPVTIIKPFNRKGYFTCLSVEFDEIKMEHVFRTCWKVSAKVVFKSPVQQNKFGAQYIRFILKDATDTRMEALAYDQQADRFNGTIQSGLVYDFTNVGFQPTDVPTYANLTMQAKFCMILTPKTALRKPRFVDFGAIFTDAISDDMFIVWWQALVSQYCCMSATWLKKLDILTVSRRLKDKIIEGRKKHETASTPAYPGHVNQDAIHADIITTPPSKKATNSESEEHGVCKVSMPNINVPSNLIRSMFGQTYEYLPQDYELTDEDVMAIFLIEDLTENCTLVISAYIHCMREQANNDKKVKYENPFLSDMLKAAGLQGLQYHLNIIGRQQDLPSHKWGDLNVIKWPIIEQLKERIQEDSSSCGLFMLKLMENWTGESLSRSITQLQTILKKDEPLESDCFNMAIRKFMYEKIEMIHKTKEAISNHCLDLQFWILIPVRHARSFIVLVVDQESQTLYVLDPNPLMPEYKNNPNMRYTRKLITICDHFNKAMRKACPGSRWNEDINLWRQVIVNNPVYSRMVTS
uniref:Ubiquitin-like protease family profile domain-containing protein n=1 Tax=Oryza nivara TaxID=4536 RepID=A0A0E0I0N2_ORYNI